MYDKGSIAAAENRVREMNRVTKQYLDRANSSMAGGNNTIPQNRHGGRANVTGNTRFEPVQNPPAHHNDPRDSHSPHPPHEMPKEKEEPCAGASRSLQGMGGDGILVILIIILLMEEKSDMRLIAALVYMLL
jgi:hypothetical protein